MLSFSQDTILTLSKNYLHIIYKLPTQYLHTIYTLPTHYLLHIIYTLFTHYVQTQYTPSTHYLHTIYWPGPRARAGGSYLSRRAESGPLCDTSGSAPASPDWTPRNIFLKIFSFNIFIVYYTTNVPGSCLQLPVHSPAAAQSPSSSPGWIVTCTV